MKIGCCVSIKNIENAKKIGFDFVELSATEIMNINDLDWNDIKDKILYANIPIIGFNAFCNEKTPIIGPNANKAHWSTYLDKVIERASQLGCQNIGIGAPKAFNAFCNEKTPIIGPNANKAHWSTYLDKVIERASQLGCQNIGIGAPKARMLPNYYHYALAIEEMETFLTTAAQKAEKYHINILYEALNPKECNFGNHTKEIYDTVNKLKLSNLKIVYDVYHSINTSEKYDDIREIFTYVNHVHINSWDRNLNRFYILAKDKPYLIKLFTFLQEIDYDKTISIEANDNNFINAAPTSLKTIKQAILETKV